MVGHLKYFNSARKVVDEMNDSLGYSGDHDRLSLGRGRILPVSFLEKAWDKIEGNDGEVRIRKKVDLLRVGKLALPFRKNGYEGVGGIEFERREWGNDVFEESVRLYTNTDLDVMKKQMFPFELEFRVNVVGEIRKKWQFVGRDDCGFFDNISFDKCFVQGEYLDMVK